MNQENLVKCHTFLVSFIMSFIARMIHCFVMWCKIFSKITNQTALQEVCPNMTPFSSKVGLRKFVLASEFFFKLGFTPCKPEQPLGGME